MKVTLVNPCFLVYLQSFSDQLSGKLVTESLFDAVFTHVREAVTSLEQGDIQTHVEQLNDWSKLRHDALHKQVCNLFVTRL